MEKFTVDNFFKEKHKVLSVEFKNLYTLKLPRLWPQKSRQFDYNSIILYKNCRPAWKTSNPMMKILNIDLPFIPHPDYKYVPFCFVSLKGVLDNVYTNISDNQLDSNATDTDNLAGPNDEENAILDSAPVPGQLNSATLDPTQTQSRPSAEPQPDPASPTSLNTQSSSETSPASNDSGAASPPGSATTSASPPASGI